MPTPITLQGYHRPEVTTNDPYYFKPASQIHFDDYNAMRDQFAPVDTALGTYENLQMHRTNAYSFWNEREAAANHGLNPNGYNGSHGLNMAMLSGSGDASSVNHMWNNYNSNYQ